MRKLPRMQHTDLKSVEESEEKWGREYEVPTYILHKVRRKNGDKVDGPIQWEKMVIFSNLIKCMVFILKDSIKPQRRIN